MNAFSELLSRSFINVQIKESFPDKAIFCFLSESEKEILDVGEKLMKFVFLW